MQRITVILGAGAMVEATGVSTTTISEKVFESNAKGKKGGAEAYSAQNLKRFLLTQMYDLAKRSDVDDFDSKKKSSWEKYIADKVNFEEYFNVLELLRSYCQSYFNKGAIKEYMSPHRVFTDLLRDIKQYQEADETDPAHMSYEDVTSGLSYKVSSLHGQIYFGDSRFAPDDINKYAYDESSDVLYKYWDYKKLHTYGSVSGGGPKRTQPRETICLANLITGLMKTEKLLRNPLDVYQMGLFNAVANNSKIILIGYGFGDLYINSLLTHHLQIHGDKKRLLVIDYKTSSDWDEIRAGVRDCSLNQSDMFVTVARAIHEDGWFHRKYEDFIFSQTSDIGNGCYSPIGFKAASKKKNLGKIIDFLGGASN